jgi:S1-C subfamily serine protease
MPLRAFHADRGTLVVALLSLFTGNVLSQTLLAALEQEMRNLVNVAKPSVVTIVTTTVWGEKKDSGGLFGLFGERDSDSHQFKIGSGLIVSSDGFIVTKESVLRDAIRIEVTLANKQSFPAEMVALDSLSEIAVLKANVENLSPVRIGATASLQPGSWVTVIGNALGMPQAVSVGVVSAIHANGVFQISANVDPGSNGSPVFNAQGKAIGIVSGRMGIDKSSIATEAYFSGTALVYPLAPRLEHLRKIIRNYYETHGWLGVTVVADPGHQKRPKVLNLVQNGPAERAGIQIGDVITHFADQPIVSFTNLREMVAARRPGEKANLVVVRQDSALKFNVQIGQQTPIALTELQLAPDEDMKAAEINSGKPPAPWQSKFETLQIQQRIQALEKELRLLRSLQQKR